ncbi:hypothetical protein LTR36_003467 [Oleoguttula mirabilis]|uniref:Uncharacterized protein n=1 Tax=Oleoguttula mirabilis TaxID=1507867 RepID=A0AAV9JJ62_9PEZI|nr:hypothetical protein LTR36_003467 [Oleoguttula mirabilis]
MRFSITKNGRTKSTHNSSWFTELQHPAAAAAARALSLSAPATHFEQEHVGQRPLQLRLRWWYVPAESRDRTIAKRAFPDRRSIAVIPGGEQGLGVYTPTGPDDIGHPSPQLAGGLGRSQTVLRREGAGTSRITPTSPPSPIWSPDFTQLPATSEQPEVVYSDEALMSSAQHSVAPGKTSSDSGQQPGTDRWSQRRLQRLNTEQGFREQRQGGQAVLSPPPVSEQGGYNSVGAQYPAQQPTQPQLPLHQQPQPHPAQQAAYQTARTAQPGLPNAGPALSQTQQISNSSRSPNYQHPEQSQAHVQSLQYSPPDSGPQYQDSSRPPISQSRSYAQQQAGADDTSMSANNGGLPAPKALRSGASNRQSVHNGLSTREGSSISSAQQPGVSAFNASIVPPGGQARSQQQGDLGRVTPQPLPLGEDMSEEDVNQLIKDHKELREKYTKVKKYYFEKEDQVKQLQNSLAHQRLSQSRTSLDDSEYTTRFNRLDGLIAQLAFSIRKSWRSTPEWLDKSVNKDAVSIGKQEMTAAGRAVISHWLVHEVFNKYFHPDLETSLSAQLKTIQLNIRKFAPPAQTVEEEDYLTSKVINWRLSTLEGLQDTLRSPQCPTNRAQLTDVLKERLIAALAVHLQDPPPSDLEGGVHMIVELVISIAIHLPVESRDVVIEYFQPGYSIMAEQMKLESGIPPLAMSIADDQAERASMKSAASDITDMTENSNALGDGAPTKKRSMLSALTGTSKTKSVPAQGKHAGAGGSSSSLSRPESSQGQQKSADLPPSVRMAAGIGVQIRGRSVLVKAPVFST